MSVSKPHAAATLPVFRVTVTVIFLYLVGGFSIVSRFSKAMLPVDVNPLVGLNVGNFCIPRN